MKAVFPTGRGEGRNRRRSVLLADLSGATRVRLAGIGAFAILAALWTFGAWEIREELNDRAIHDADRATQVMAEHAAKVVGGHLSAIEQIEWLVRDLGLDAADESRTLHERLRAIQASRPEVQSVWLFDERGNVRATSIGFPPPDTNFADRDYFRAAVRGEDQYIGEVVRGRITGQLNFNLGKRLEDDQGRFLGTIVVSLFPESIVAFYRSLGQEQDLTLLMRRDGALLAANPPLSGDPAGRKLTTDLPTRLLDGSAEVVHADLDVDGERYLVAARSVAGLPLYVLHGAAAARLTREWIRLLLRYALVVVPALIGIGALVYLAYRQAQRIERARKALDDLNRDLEWRFVERTAALRETEERQRIATRAAGLGVFEWQIPGDSLVWENDRMYEIFGPMRAYPPPTRREFEENCLHPDDIGEFEQALQTGLQDGQDLRVICRGKPGQAGGPQWLEFAGRFSNDAHGRPLRMIGVVSDVTERHEAEKRRILLVDELNHRVKNTLAIVQALAHQTFRGQASDPAARRAFEGRLTALAAAHNLLTRQDWNEVDLRALAADTLRASGPVGTRLTISGPRVVLQPKQAVAVALALHELCTNAIKYGALSNETGFVTLDWVLSDDNHLSLVWTEHGGPPVSRPVARGFGSVMIEQLLAHDLGGKVAMEFRPDGLVCRVEALAPASVGSAV